MLTSDFDWPLRLLVSYLSFARTMADASALLFRDSCLPMEDRISDLLSCMTLEEKVGQMTQIDRTVATPQVIKDFFIGKDFERCKNYKYQW